MSRILVVEDEEAIAEGLLLNLGRKGHEGELARDGAEALRRARDGGWDLILLDVRLPEVDGFEVVRRLRDAGDLTPILMLTARDQPDDKVYGLKLGADDYLVKPFDLGELLARVESLLRRRAWTNGGATAAGERAGQRGESTGSASAPAGRFGAPAVAAAPATPQRLDFGDYWVDFSTYEAKTRSGIVQLSQKEIAVLRVFAARPGQVVTRRELLATVWELPHHPNTRVVDNVIVALRKSFEDSAWRPRHILSVRGVGYRFVP
ncbi:MAG TPA: response regulator transcription factor [Thermoanaerobaculia bacterium]|jgi:DNA-binding response OmpR family regulator|nr:response regulator transcription factor [Thermoanaerobaculia bacterium]